MEEQLQEQTIDIEQLKNESRERSFEAIPLQSESVIRKFLKAGALSLAIGMGAKKYAKDYSDILTVGGTVLSMYVLNKDEDYSGDMMALGALFGMKYGSKAGVTFLRNNQTQLAKFASHLKYMDEVKQNIQFAQFGMAQSFGTAFRKKASELYENSNRETGMIENVFRFARTTVSTIASGVANIFKHEDGVLEGIHQLFKNAVDNPIVKSYKENPLMEEFEGLGRVARQMLENTGVSFSDEEWKTIGFHKIKTMKDKIFAANPESIPGIKKDYQEFEKKYKMFRKLHDIETSTTFQDLTGMFSEISSDGKFSLRKERILKGDYNFNDVLQNLVKRFEESQLQNMSQDQYNALRNKDELFKKYIKNEIPHGEELLDHLIAKDKKDFSYEDMYNLYFNKKEVLKLSELDKETREHILSKNDKLFKISTELNEDTLLPEDKITGFNNFDILKGFKFTNVIEKSDKFGIVDKTLMDSKLATLRVGKAIESLFPAYYAPHSVFFNSMTRTWNPTGLFDTKGMMREYIGEHFLELQGRTTKVSGGKNLLEMIFKKQYISETISNDIDEKIEDMSRIVRSKFDKMSKRIPIEKRFRKAYAQSGYQANDIPKIKEFSNFVTREGEYKFYYQKHLLAATKEETRTLRKNRKIDFTVSQILEGKGIRGKLNRFFNSDFNFTPFRYDMETLERKGGFRFVHANDGMYHDDNNAFQSVYEFLSKASFGKIKGPTEYMPQANIFDITQANNTIDKVYNKLSRNIADQILMVQGVEYSEGINEEIMYAFHKYGLSKYVKKAFGDMQDNVMRIMTAEGASFMDQDAIDLVNVLKVAKKESAKAFKLLDDSSSPKDVQEVIGDFSNKFSGYIEQIFSSNKYQQIRQKYPTGTMDKIMNTLYTSMSFISEDFMTYTKDSGKKGIGVFSAFDNYLNSIKNTNTRQQYLNVFKDLAEDIQTSLAKHLETITEDSEMYGVLKQIEVPHKEMSLYEQLRNARKSFRDDFFNDPNFKINEGSETYQSQMWRKLKQKGFDPETYSQHPLFQPFNLFKGNRYADVLLDKDFDKETFDIFANEVKVGKHTMDFNKVEEQFSYFKDVNDKYKKSTHSISSNILSLSKKLSTIERFNYIGNENNNATSIILKDSFTLHKDLKTTFDDLKEWALNLVINRQAQQKKTKEILDKALKEYQVNRTSIFSHEFLNTKSRFGAYKSVPTNKLQDALEVLGISRTLPNKSFMTHRLLPFIGAYLGFQALDSFTDAVIPDWVPLIGQGGITGTLAKGVAYGMWGTQAVMNVTGMTSVFRWLDNKTDGAISSSTGNFLVGDSEETYDVLFKGKAVRVNKNRFWNTAGRQSFLGEEFDQYRPHVLYTLMNPTTGVHAHGDGYLDKWAKFFRKDFALTRYPWIALDPYREERIAYRKYGAIYPKTQQLFVDVPVVGHLLSNTIGEILKPTQYVGEDQWKIDDEIMVNPRHKEGDSSTAPFLKYYNEHGLFNLKAYMRAGFEALEDLKTWAGLPGFMLGKGTELLFGQQTPYEQLVTLQSLTDHVSIYSDYDKYKLGGFFELTEPIRRLIDKPDNVGMIHINPLRQKLPHWMPDYYKKGNNPYMNMSFGSYIMPSDDFNKTINHIDTQNQNLNRFRILSMVAPNTKEFEEMRNRVMNKEDNMTNSEKIHYYESLSYAEKHNTRLYQNEYVKAKNIIDKEITIKEKLTPYEFIGTDNKRYKLDTVTSDFNQLATRYGKEKASKLMERLDSQFKVGEKYNFRMSTDASFSGGIDDEGDFFRVDHKSVSNDLNLNNSGYREDNSGWFLAMPFNRIRNNAMPMQFEKLFGIKDPYTEWSTETVQSPYFRDWDSPIESFVAPFYNLSANSSISGAAFKMTANDVFEQSNSTFNVFGTLATLGMAKSFINMATKSQNRSEEYQTETEVGDIVEQMKYANGQKSVYNIEGNEYLSTLKKMVNEQDSVFLKDLLNVRSEKKRKQILKFGNQRLQTVLQTVWNRQQQHINNRNIYDNVGMNAPEEVNTYGAQFTKNQTALRNRLKKQMGVEYSKLDAKRQGLINAYYGTVSENEERFIRKKAYEQYHDIDVQTRSTIYNQGNINISTYY